jgi:hypothetical protein
VNTSGFIEERTAYGLKQAELGIPGRVGLTDGKRKKTARTTGVDVSLPTRAPRYAQSERAHPRRAARSFRLVSPMMVSAPLVVAELNVVHRGQFEIVA